MKLEEKIKLIKFIDDARYNKDNILLSTGIKYKCPKNKSNCKILNYVLV